MLPNAAVEVGLFSVEGRIQLQFRITFQSRLRDIVADNNRVIKRKESKSALVSLGKKALEQHGTYGAGREEKHDACESIIKHFKTWIKFP